MGRYPIEKPSADEMRRAIGINSSHSLKKGMRILRYKIESEQAKHVKIQPGMCVQDDRIIECHVPDNGDMATWWRVFGEDDITGRNGH